MLRREVLVGGAALLFAGCTTGIIGGGPSPTDSQGQTTTGGAGITTTAGTGSTGGAQTTGNPSMTGAPTVTYAMPRLTNVQYLNTVHDLLPMVTFTDPDLPNENVVSGFVNASNGQTATALLIEDYEAAAEQVAAAASANAATAFGCQPATTADEDACAQAFVTDFGKRAYRRPLTSDESSRMTAFYKAQRATLDFPTSMGAVVQVFLQSPAFLYRLEAGAMPGATGLNLLTSYELASRLSYFLTNTTPDSALMAAADQDLLQDPTQIETQARRLLADPRARAAVATFNYQWLKLSKTENMTKDATKFPMFTPAIAQALHDSTVQFIDHVFWDKGTLTDLLTDPEAYVSDPIASYFGVPAPGSSTLTLVNPDPTQRAGVLLQAGLLAGLSGPVDDSPVQRGVLVLDSLLCNRPPPPPPGVNAAIPPLDPNAPMTTRDRLTAHQQGSCASCHTIIDGIGFAFENYDAVGTWRTEDSNLPVDASANLSGTDVDGPLVGGVAMVERLATSHQVLQCVSYQWLRYSLGLDTTQINLPAAQTVADQFSAAGGAFSELIVSIAKSDYFRSVQIGN